jgi:hypothetical protein
MAMMDEPLDDLAKGYMRHIKWMHFGRLILVILSFTIGFHLLVMIGVIPFSVVWGGRLENASQMLVFESVSITVSILIMWVVSMKVGYTEQRLSDTVLRVLFWVFAGLFALNTIGNLLSTSTVEMILFTPITFLLSISFVKMARA